MNKKEFLRYQQYQDQLQSQERLSQRDLLIEAVYKHAEGHIAKHVANVEVYLNQSVGIGEHSDIIEAIEHELDQIAKYHDQLEALDRYIEP